VPPFLNTYYPQLDMLANKYLNNWSGIPTRGCTNLSILHPYRIGIKTSLQLYMEGHAGNYMICKVKADHQVNFALESQLARESQWVGKFSNVVKCHKIDEKVFENMMIPTQENFLTMKPLLTFNYKNLKRRSDRRSSLNIWKCGIQDSKIYSYRVIS
jgi:hypothetical protein